MRRAVTLTFATLLAVATLATALSPLASPSPIGSKAIGQLNGEAMRDATLAARIEHHLREHGIDHPRKLVDVQTTDPLTRARLVLQEEVLHGRTPLAWTDLAKADALLALRPLDRADEDLASGVARLAAAAGAPFTPFERAELQRRADAVPADLRAPLARLVARTADAYEAQAPLARTVVARAAAADEPVDLVLTATEREAMLSNALALVAASNAFRAETEGLALPATTTALFRDPLGLVVVGGIGNDEHLADGVFGDPILAVDPAGDDTYRHAAGGACPDTRSLAHVCNGLALALALDLGGSDTYAFAASEPRAAQGAGSIGGVGVLVDATGNDVYSSHMRRTLRFPIFTYVDGGMQGFGQAGVGILLDAQGDDQYTADVSTAGSSIWNFGQGYGGVGGIGIIADGAGDDQYLAHGLASNMYRGAFQGLYTNGASIYGGVGISTDLGKGHDVYYAWDAATSTDYYAQGFGAFGGLGILFEDGGDDDYTAGEEIVNNPTGTNLIVPLLNCAFGTGSFGGVGVFLEMGGNDRYFGDSRSPRAAYTMNEGFGGPGVAYGLFVDVSGDDGHFMEANGGAGSATFGRGVLVASGGDILGTGNNLFGTYLDGGGRDQYTGASPSADGRTWVAGADLNLLPGDLFG